MRKTLTTNEINKLVADTIEKMEAKKGTPTTPYIQMDLSVYAFNTLEAIKEAFVAAGIRFEDRWNDGSNFVVPIDVKCVQPIFRGGRRDTFTKSDGPICEPGQAKKPLNMGRRDAFTKSLEDQIKDAEKLVKDGTPKEIQERTL